MARNAQPLAQPAQPGLSVVYRDLRALVPYANNARQHSAGQINKIKASLKEFGWANAMLVAENEMIAGHARLKAAIALLDEGIAIPHSSDPMRGPTIDLSHLSVAQRRAYVLADNRLAEEAVWDLDLLRGEIEALQTSDAFDVGLAGFDSNEIDVIMRGWQADFTRQGQTEAVIDPLMGLIRVRYLRTDHDKVWTAIRAALEPFSGASAEQI